LELTNGSSDLILLGRRVVVHLEISEALPLSDLLIYVITAAVLKKIKPIK
jgi:hypothetical protein